MNPARSLGPVLAGGIWDAHWIYWIAPITGMLNAVRVYEFLRPASAAGATAGVALGVDGPLQARAAAHG
jgi:hypothetical protein